MHEEPPRHTVTFGDARGLNRANESLATKSEVRLARAIVRRNHHHGFTVNLELVHSCKQLPIDLTFDELMRCVIPVKTLTCYMRGGLRWSSTGRKAHLRKAYAVTMQVTSSPRMRRGKPGGWKRRSRIRRSCKG